MDITQLLVAVFAVAVGWRFNKEKKLGCIGLGYVSLVAFVISFFAVILTSVLISNTIDIVSSYFIDGNMSSIEWSGELIIMAFGLFIMWLVVFLASMGMVLYVCGMGMKRYFKLIQNIGAYFFIPLLMIGFEALLIFAFFYGNDIPTFATAILLFFILILGLAIWAYIKMTFFSKAKLKWTKTGTGSWGADWVAEGEEKVEIKQLPKTTKKKKMVPLNEEYLKKIDNYRKK